MTVSMTSGICSAPFGVDQPLQRRDIHVALEIEARLRVGGFGDGQVHGARAGEFDIGAGGIEVRVAGDDVAGLAQHGEEDALRRAALVRGDHVAEAGEFIDHVLQAEETLAAGVGFVTAHHRRPLLRGHGAGAGIGQQVDQDVTRWNQEKVIAGFPQVLLAFVARGVPQRLYALDAERLDDGLHRARSGEAGRLGAALKSFDDGLNQMFGHYRAGGPGEVGTEDEEGRHTVHARPEDLAGNLDVLHREHAGADAVGDALADVFKQLLSHGAAAGVAVRGALPLDEEGNAVMRWGVRCRSRCRHGALR